jgi:hypothetical protein
MPETEDRLRSLCAMHWASQPAARVVSGFPGVGKTRLFLGNPGLVSDSDSSQFAKGEVFAEEYVKHIQYQRELPDMRLVLVSSHAVVRKALVEAGIPFSLAYPDATLKTEYLIRYLRRGSPPAFVEMMDRNWSVFIGQCERQPGCQRIRLAAGQFLGDVIEVS